MYPTDHEMSTRAFAQFMGWFGQVTPQLACRFDVIVTVLIKQVTNGISFCFSLFGTGAVIHTLGLERALLLFPSLVLGCVLIVYAFHDLWVVFCVMMVRKSRMRS
jgi:hypothetical protein